MTSATLQLFQGGAASGAHDVYDALVRLLIAAALGGLVSLLYQASRSADARSPGFSSTLVMLAPLITMVTMAVGQNVAAAFTLVGTLAIVRFRTAVRDSRDMAFVIFSVAVGMALGAFELVVALCGVGVVGAIVLGLRALERSKQGVETAVLRLSISPPDADPSVYAPTLGRYAQSFTVRRAAVDRESGVLELRVGVSGVDPSRSPALLVELLALPAVVRASFAPDEVD